MSISTKSMRAAAAIAASLAIAGCVERKMMIRSDPPGALITVDGEDSELKTPAEIPFDFGGTRAITLTAPGHKVLDTTAKLEDPWFTYFPLDVFAEFLYPGTIRDTQVFDYKLQPWSAAVSPDEISRLKQKISDLKLRAAEYRAGGAEGPGKAPPPPPPPATTPPAPKK
jgi:hypothetical protein